VCVACGMWHDECTACCSTVGCLAVSLLNLPATRRQATQSSCASSTQSVRQSVNQSVSHSPVCQSNRCCPCPFVWHDYRASIFASHAKYAPKCGANEMNTLNAHAHSCCHSCLPPSALSLPLAFAACHS